MKPMQQSKQQNKCERCKKLKALVVKSKLNAEKHRKRKITVPREEISKTKATKSETLNVIKSLQNATTP